MFPDVRVICGAERAVVYVDGGIEFSAWVNDKLGYVVDDDPSDTIKMLALAVRREAYPRLSPMTLADLSD